MKASTLRMVLPVGLALLVTLTACGRKEEPQETAPVESAPDVAVTEPVPAEPAGVGAPAEAPSDTPVVVPPDGTPTGSPATPPATTTPAPTPQASAPTTTPAPSATTAAAGNAQGAQLYKISCSTCHGAEGKGDGVAAAALNPKPANFATGDFKYDTNGNGKPGEIEDIRTIVRDGTAKHGGSPLMAPWPTLSDKQLQAVAEHVKSLHTD